MEYEYKILLKKLALYSAFVIIIAVACSLMVESIVSIDPFVDAQNTTEKNNDTNESGTIANLALPIRPPFA